MYKYETHLHTSPVSKCARASVRETLEFYKDMGYAGVFITNHFLDGNLSMDCSCSYEDRINFYFSDYENGVELSRELGIKALCGIEISHKGTDFLVYGLSKDWFLKHPRIMDMEKSSELEFLMESGALVVQAHPYREASYIDHIRLYPRCVHGVEIVNANRKESENKMAKVYAENYGLIPFAGSDNHIGKEQKKLAGMSFETPILNEEDFVKRVKNGQAHIFTYDIQ